MHRMEKTCDIDVPVRVAYDQWTQFEQFPAFMEGVEKVVQLDDRHLHWVAEIAGTRREWDAEIVEQKRDTRIAWRSRGGAQNAGVVTFRPAGNDKTEVTLELDFEPEGAVEKAGEKLGFVSKQAEGDLKRFKKFIESRGVETGGWRGNVN